MKWLFTLAVNLAIISGFTEGVPVDCAVEWLSRLNVVPCTPRETTTLPAANQYGVYRTQLDTSAPACRYKNPYAVFKSGDNKGESKGNQIIGNIATLGTEQLRVIYSPGFELIPQENYPNQVLVNYNIQCGEDELAFYNITDIDLQERCDGSCVDYVEVDRGDFGTSESCGQQAGDNMLSLNTNIFTVIFRTSAFTVHSGFRAYIICFPQNEAETTDTQRKKRDLAEFHSKWRHNSQREKRRSITLIKVRLGDTVFFDNGVVKIFQEGKFIQCHVVKVLYTLDRYGNREVISHGVRYFTDAGPLYIVRSVAHYQRFIIDPRGVKPTPEEAEVISTMINAIYDTMIPTEMSNVTKNNTQDTIYWPLADDAIEEALRNERACNPVVRALARAVLTISERQDPVRHQELKKQVEREKTKLSQCVCPVLEDIENGAVRQSGTTVNSTVAYVCDPGHAIIGDKVRQCQDDGTWSGQQPSCVDPANIIFRCYFATETGTINNICVNCVTNIETLCYRCKIDDQEPVNCKMPYTSQDLPPGVHTLSVTAVVNDYPVPSLDPIVHTFVVPHHVCPVLPDIPCGEVMQGSRRVGSTADYTCYLGKTLIGDGTRWCQENGMWSGEQPSCVVACPVLENIEHGAVLQSGITVGSIAHYVCDAGSIIVGDETRHCLDNGRWSGQTPSCVNLATIRAGCQFNWTSNTCTITANCRANVDRIQYRCQLGNEKPFICEMPYTSSPLDPAAGPFSFTVFGVANNRIVLNPLTNIISVSQLECD